MTNPIERAKTTSDLRIAAAVEEGLSLVVTRRDLADLALASAQHMRGEDADPTGMIPEGTAALTALRAHPETWYDPIHWDEALLLSSDDPNRVARFVGSTRPVFFGELALYQAVKRGLDLSAAKDPILLDCRVRGGSHDMAAAGRLVGLPWPIGERITAGLAAAWMLGLFNVLVLAEKAERAALNAKGVSRLMVAFGKETPEFSAEIARLNRPESTPEEVWGRLSGKERAKILSKASAEEREMAFAGGPSD